MREMFNIIIVFAVATFIALVVILCWPAEARTYTITADPGGEVYSYARRWDALRKDYIRVEGRCNSSCTMVLNNYPHMCVAPGARLGFHPAYYFTLIGYMLSHDGTAMLWSRYPDDIRAMLRKRGGLVPHGGWWRPGMTYFRGSELPRRYRC